MLNSLEVVEETNIDHTKVRRHKVNHDTKHGTRPVTLFHWETSKLFRWYSKLVALVTL